jgi:hypothetical protein
LLRKSSGNWSVTATCGFEAANNWALISRKFSGLPVMLLSVIEHGNAAPPLRLWRFDENRTAVLGKVVGYQMASSGNRMSVVIRVITGLSLDNALGAIQSQSQSTETRLQPRQTLHQQAQAVPPPRHTL